MHKPVTMGEFARMLSFLPDEWQALARGDIALCEYGGMIILCNSNLPPLVFQGGKWEKLAISSKEGMVVFPAPPEAKHMTASEVLARSHTVDPEIEKRRAASRARVGRPITDPWNND